MTASAARAAFTELLDVLRAAGEQTLGEARGIVEPDDVAEGLRNLTHILQSGLYSHQEFDPAHPVFRRIVSPTRSFTGDNPDAIYFEAPVDAAHEYLVRGNIAGAVYTSLTMEAGAVDGKYATRIAGVINDTQIDVDAAGNYEVRVGGAPSDRNWLGIPPEGGRLTTRHYFEWPTPAAASQTLSVPLSIETTVPVPPEPRWDDERVARAIGRVVNHVRGKTIDAPAPGAVQPSFLSTIPNQFPKPVPPGTMAFAAFDAAYSMAPYRIERDEALVITGRWPDCRFANVCLWNRFAQMYDYTTRSVSRNRANTELDGDGNFRMVLAHEDPRLPNWLDTEGRTTGTIFWRYFLPQGDIETPQATVVKLESLRV